MAFSSASKNPVVVVVVVVVVLVIDFTSGKRGYGTIILSCGVPSVSVNTLAINSTKKSLGSRSTTMNILACFALMELSVPPHRVR